jgi:hypothetical protein
VAPLNYPPSPVAPDIEIVDNTVNEAGKRL